MIVYMRLIIMRVAVLLWVQCKVSLLISKKWVLDWLVASGLSFLKFKIELKFKVKILKLNFVSDQC